MLTMAFGDMEVVLQKYEAFYGIHTGGKDGNDDLRAT